MKASTHSPVIADAPAAKTSTRRSGFRIRFSRTRVREEARVLAHPVRSVLA